MALARTITLTGLLALTAAGAGLAQADDRVAVATSRAAAPTTGRMEADGQMQVGRYTTMRAAPVAQASDPLSVYVQLSYPRQIVRTVGDAIDHTLVRTGWRLVDRTALSPEAARFLQLPLPESQRTLGPYPVRTLLGVLLGNTWCWQEDPVQRLVWFTAAQAQTTQKGAGAGAGTAIEPVPAAIEAAITSPVRLFSPATGEN